MHNDGHKLLYYAHSKEKFGIPKLLQGLSPLKIKKINLSLKKALKNNSELFEMLMVQGNLYTFGL